MGYCEFTSKASSFRESWVLIVSCPLLCCLSFLRPRRGWHPATSSPTFCPHNAGRSCQCDFPVWHLLLPFSPPVVIRGSALHRNWRLIPIGQSRKSGSDTIPRI